MDNAPAPVHASWTVTGQMETTEFNQQGQVQKGVKVEFTTGQGHTGTVFVPQAQYNPDMVRQLVQARADLMDQVGSLSSSG
jgi:hypothetical protein